MRFVADRHPDRRYCVKDTYLDEIVSDILSRREAQEEAARMNEEMDSVVADLNPDEYEDREPVEIPDEDFDADDLPDLTMDDIVGHEDEWLDDEE